MYDDILQVLSVRCGDGTYQLYCQRQQFASLD